MRVRFMHTDKKLPKLMIAKVVCCFLDIFVCLVWIILFYKFPFIY